MIFYFDRGAQIAPCIVSKVRHALQLKAKTPSNTKECKPAYWAEACQIIGLDAEKSDQEIQVAIALYDHYMNAH